MRKITPNYMFNKFDVVNCWLLLIFVQQDCSLTLARMKDTTMPERGIYFYLNKVKQKEKCDKRVFEIYWWKNVTHVTMFVLLVRPISICYVYKFFIDYLQFIDFMKALSHLSGKYCLFKSHLFFKIKKIQNVISKFLIQFFFRK